MIDDIFGKIPPLLDQKTSKSILDGIRWNNGLYLGAYEVWEEASSANTKTVKSLKEVLIYEEFLRKNLPSLTAEFIIANSSPGKIKKYNDLVDQYNRELVWIRKSGNPLQSTRNCTRS